MNLSSKFQWKKKQQEGRHLVSKFSVQYWAYGKPSIAREKVWEMYNKKRVDSTLNSNCSAKKNWVQVVAGSPRKEKQNPLVANWISKPKMMKA